VTQQDTGCLRVLSGAKSLPGAIQASFLPSGHLMTPSCSVIIAFGIVTEILINFMPLDFQLVFFVASSCLVESSEDPAITHTPPPRLCSSHISILGVG
jgi:hypothetical protein